jgi:HlyD family secretion protein
MNRRVLTIIIVLVVIAGGIFAFGAKGDSSGKDLNQYKVAKVDTGEVKKTVSASGTLQAWDAFDIKARAGGELILLAVDVGDVVKKGQLLARIDPLDVQLTLNQAKANDESSIAHKDQSVQTYELGKVSTVISIEDARAALLSAQANLLSAKASLNTADAQAKAQPALTAATIANAQAAYDQAVKQLAQTVATNEQDRATAKATYDEAIANQVNARQSLERQQALVTKGFVSQSTVDAAQASLSVLDAQVASAKTKMDTVDAELTANLEAAQAHVAQAKAALESAKASVVDIENKQDLARQAAAAVNQAAAQVVRSKVALDQAIANQQNDEIKKLDIKAADAAIAGAQAALVNAQVSMDRTTVRAPSDGVILLKYVDQGTIIASALGVASAGQSIVQMGDVSRMYVDVAVDETDIANVDVGQVVDVNVEAYPGVPFQGKVIRINPEAQVDQNVTTVHVRVEIDNSAPTFRLLKPAMDVTCEFVIGKKPNVLRVPNEAIREDDQGKYVETASGGKQAPVDPQTGPADPNILINIKKKHVAVEVGLQGNEYTEVTKGVQVGDQIITQTIEPAPPTQGGSPFGGGGMGRGGFGGGGRR